MATFRYTVGPWNVHEGNETFGPGNRKSIPFEDAIRRVKELGFDAAETYKWQGLDYDAVRAACEETGVQLLSMCTSEFRMTDPAFRTLWLEGLKESCEAAKKLSVDTVFMLSAQEEAEDEV